MAAIFKSSLQNLSPLPTSLKVEPLAKPKTGLKFFVNTTKPKTKVLAVFGQKLKVSTLSLRPVMNTGPGVQHINMEKTYVQQNIYILTINFLGLSDAKGINSFNLDEFQIVHRISLNGITGTLAHR